MENKNNNPKLTPEDQQWLDELLGEAAPIEEIGADEQAVSAAGLSSPDELDLENILAEDWDNTAEIPSEEPVPEFPENPEQTSAIPAEEVPECDFDPEHMDLSAYMEPEASENPPAPEADDGSAEQAEPQEDSAVRKKRPKRKKGSGLLGIPHILSTVIWIVIILAAGVALGRTLWVCTADLMAFGKGNNEVTITITDGDDLDSVSQKLAEANLIRYPGLFKTFAELTGKDERISVGTFTLNSSLDYNAMINAMGSNAPAREVVEVMFPEGYNCAQIFKLLEKNNVCTAAELEEYAANGELDDYWFLEGVPRGTPYCLEGYLAPDTYKFYTNDEPKRVLEKLLDEFDSRFTDKLKEQLTTLQERYNKGLASSGASAEYIAAHPMTLHSVITLASIIEKETSNSEESFDIASVFLNRLMNPGSYPTLDSDATVYYAIGDYFGEKEELTQSDLNSDSPYNTRKAQGLPPGPICNTGVNSIYAALNPNPTNYYFFVYDAKAEQHLFASTYSEHQQNVDKLGG